MSPMLMRWIRRMLWLDRVQAVTHLDVCPAERDPETERKIRKVHGRLAKEMIDLERASWQVQQELAGGVLKIVSRGY